MQQAEELAKKFIWIDEGECLGNTDIFRRGIVKGFESRQGEVDKLKQMVEELQELNSLLNRKQ